MSREKRIGCDTAARRFCTDNYDWLVETSERAIAKYGFSGQGRDIAHDVLDKFGCVADDKWSNIENKRGYTAQAIKHCAKDFSDEQSHFVDLPPVVFSSAGVQACEASILVAEARKHLSDDELQLVDLLYEGYSPAEMANRLGLEGAALRKRLQRLRNKLRLVIDGKDVIRNSKSSNGDYATAMD